MLRSKNKTSLIYGHCEWLINRYFNKSVYSSERPIVLLSACADKEQTGDFKYNGGIKFFNMCAKLLRSKGFLAYIVTYDGKYQPWMIDHQPHISLQTAREWKEAGRNLKFFTTWIAAVAFNTLADKIYLHDAEPAYSFGIHFPLIKDAVESNRLALSTETRAEQAYFRALLNEDTCLIPPYCDPDYFFPDASKRVKNRIGYVLEGPDTEAQIEIIKKKLKTLGVKAEFIRVSGPESTFNAQIQSCDLYLGLNPGKDKFKCEGLGRMHLEAMSLGAVVVAFDVGGNREFLFDYVNGCLIEQGNLDKMTEALIFLIRNPQKKEELRKNAQWVCTHIFTKERMWPEFKRALELNGFNDFDTNAPTGSILNRQELNLLLGAPSYLAEEEVPIFNKYAPQAEKTIVEIGVAYGASALLFLFAKQPLTKLYSIDVFTMAEETKPPKGGPTPPSYESCLKNVRRGADIVGKEKVLDEWQLIKSSSHEVAQTWQRKVDLIFIDGDHSYEGVRRDFDDWFPLVKKGGIIFLHDSRLLPGSSKDEFNRGWDGPTKLARELRKRKDVKLIDKAYSLTVWQKA